MSLFIKLKLIIPISWSEKNIIIIPATILKISELFKKNFPINEAVELAKTFGTESSPRFVNGVLGSVAGSYKSWSGSSDIAF